MGNGQNNLTLETKSKVVFTNGCFDLLHVGHFRLLQFCKKLADKGQVIVAIDTDHKIKKDKGEFRPFEDSDSRRMSLLSTKLVSRVLYFSSNEQLYSVIENIKPDIIVKGSDWKQKKVVGSDIAEVKFFEYDDRWSTTKTAELVKKKLLQSYMKKLEGM